MSKPAIQLSPERHAQVKAIGDALGGLTYAETIGYMVNAEIAKGTIPAGIDGVVISSSDDGLTVTFNDQPPVKFSLDGAQVLASTLREFANAEKRAEKLVNVHHNFTIERKGNGVKLTVPLTGNTTKSFSRDLARDLADLLNT